MKKHHSVSESEALEIVQEFKYLGIIILAFSPKEYQN